MKCYHLLFVGLGLELVSLQSAAAFALTFLINLTCSWAGSSASRGRGSLGRRVLGPFCGFIITAAHKSLLFPLWLCLEGCTSPRPGPDSPARLSHITAGVVFPRAAPHPTAQGMP